MRDEANITKMENDLQPTFTNVIEKCYVAVTIWQIKTENATNCHCKAEKEEDEHKIP